MADDWEVSFPADMTSAIVQQAYFDGDENPLGGFLTFMPSSAFTINGTGTSVRIPARLSGTETWPGTDAGMSPWAFSMEGSGKIYIWKGVLLARLFCSDNPGVVTDDGKPLTYHVQEHFAGGREFDISVPVAAAGTSPYISTLIIPGSVQPFNYDPLNPLGDLSAAIPQK